jgi:hypothetical protein
MSFTVDPAARERALPFIDQVPSSNENVETTEPGDPDSPAASGDGGSVPASVVTAGSMPMPVGMSDQTMMEYCEAQMQSLSGQMDNIFSQQEQNNDDANGLAQVIAVFQQYSGGISSKDPDPKGECTQVEQALYNYITQLQGTNPNFADMGKLIQTYNNLLYSGTGPIGSASNPNDPNAPYLPFINENEYPPVTNGYSTDNSIGDTEMQGYLQSLNGVQSDLTSGNQMNMIELQSLASQQQTAVQLTTNIIQSLDDATQKVAENVGH